MTENGKNTKEMKGSKIFSLVDAEDNYEKNKQNFRIARPGLYPSEASVKYKDGDRTIVLGKCMRAAWYRALSVPRDTGINVSLMMKAHLGKWDETGAVQRWKEMGIWLGNNIKFYNPEIALSGELDAILKDLVTNQKLGYECKTFYNYNANRSLCGVKKERGTGKFIPGRPKPEHFLQALLYCWEYRNILDGYRLYYLERGDGHRVEFGVGFEKNAEGKHQCYWEQIPGKYWNAFAEGKVFAPYCIEDIHDRYKELLQLLRKRILPPKDFSSDWDANTIEYLHEKGEISKTKFDKWVKDPVKNKLSDWHCSYCEWCDKCKEDELNNENRGEK